MMNVNNISKNEVNFKSGIGTLYKALYTLGNNDMLNASAIDVFAMDTPRTIVEFKNRGQNAGIEMGFREYTGTFIAEFSAAVFALIASKVFSKFYKPDIKVNSNSWATNNAIDTFSDIFKKSSDNLHDFVKNTLNSIKGVSGKKIVSFSDVPEDKSKPIIDSLTSLITNKSLDKKKSKQVTESVKTAIIDSIGADNTIILSSGKNCVKSNLSHMLRDTVDLGKNVFFNEQNSKRIPETLNKLKSMNKSRIALAIPLSMGLAITNQYINRKLTKKRTGIDNFVGENGYEQNIQNNNEKKKENGLFAKKLLSAGIFLAMLTKVMDIKKPIDLINKLEFDGPATGGNAIKTIYGTLILGRIFASKDSTELRETTLRDYFGFLSWLVLGGFVAKGVGQLLDPKQNNLFNVSKEGKGVSHWLKDVSLKSQKEIIAQGGNISKNLKNLNIAQLSGIAYSAVMLGVLLPKLNISMTKHSEKKQDKKYISQFLIENTFAKFDKEISLNSKKQ